MADNKASILVPWDFTETSENALQHAINLAKKADNDVILMHIIEKGSFFAKKSNKAIEAERVEYEAKFKALTQEFFMKYTFKPKYIIAVGELIKTTAEEAKKNKVNLIIIGTNHLIRESHMKTKGLLKLNMLADIPIIIAKTPPPRPYYIEVVFPIDHDKKNKDKVAWAIYLAKYYSCNINIIKPFSIDSLDKKNLNNNIYFAKKAFDNKGIIYGIKTAKKDENFHTSTCNFSQKIDADLILVMSYAFKHFAEVEKNEFSIPVMLVNLNQKIRKLGKFN
ncbi:universal stress protein [sediment metagenome]|uniref:Universal stress protein n=1 Tax=sediment metagenome TaxID=749907 RepID=D9PI77_9ZZZZ